MHSDTTIESIVYRIIFSNNESDNGIQKGKYVNENGYETDAISEWLGSLLTLNESREWVNMVAS